MLSLPHPSPSCRAPKTHKSQTSSRAVKQQLKSVKRYELWQLSLALVLSSVYNISDILIAQDMHVCVCVCVAQMQ